MAADTILIGDSIEAFGVGEGSGPSSVTPVGLGNSPMKIALGLEHPGAKGCRPEQQSQ